MLRRSIQIGLSLLGLYVVLSIAAGIYLAEAAIHPHRRPVSGRARYMAMVETYSNAGVEDVAVDTTYQVKLKGWYVQPKNWNHEAVILIHGVSDDREGGIRSSASRFACAWRERRSDCHLWSHGTIRRSDVGHMAASTHAWMH